MIELGKNITQDFSEATSREWIETNGIGGYASGTISGANSRRYHGLLVAAAKPPLGRIVMLSKFEETLVIDGKRIELSSNKYPGAVHPLGFQFLSSFRLDPFPVWTYEIDGIGIEKSVFMIDGENTTACEWRIIPKNAAKRSIQFEMRPLIAFRDHHHLRHEDNASNFSLTQNDGLISIKSHEDIPELFMAHNAQEIATSGFWYRDFEYEIEKERGFDFTEDLFQPFILRFNDFTANVVVSTEKHNSTDLPKLKKGELKRRATLVARSGAKDDFSRQLVLAADQFIVGRGDGKTVIAGYPWFSDWGRDTMIALPGLTLAANRPEIAKSILAEFSKHISQGMLPNRFPDAGEIPEYNTVDATLWFFNAVFYYARKTQDYDFIRGELYEKLVNIIEWHVQGTRYGIHVDTDGLLCAGEEGVQLTWMDAKIAHWVVTPRTGKPVEIQALWYNALRIMADFATKFDDADSAERFADMARIARENFNGQFWYQDGAYLYDVIDGEKKDASIRPNEIFAVSLPYSMLDEARAKQVVEKVQSELLTPVGLRSLSPSDPDYVGIYIGSPRDRDACYHQGTVWGWLIGPFIDAWRKVHPNDEVSESKVDEMLAGFASHMKDAAVGQISEIFDGDFPHAPRGCPAQAWSVAEILRILSEKPKVFRFDWNSLQIETGSTETEV